MVSNGRVRIRYQVCCRGSAAVVACRCRGRVPPRVGCAHAGARMKQAPGMSGGRGYGGIFHVSGEPEWHEEEIVSKKLGVSAVVQQGGASVL